MYNIYEEVKDSSRPLYKMMRQIGVQKEKLGPGIVIPAIKVIVDEVNCVLTRGTGSDRHRNNRAVTGKPIISSNIVKNRPRRRLHHHL